MASRAVTSVSAETRRQRHHSGAARTPPITPRTNNPISPPAVATMVRSPRAAPTPSRVELPLMKETKKPPSCRNPTASM
jgi:hypothetical protein